MKKILVLGAGRSASSLIKYLLDNSFAEGWHITVTDKSEEMARLKTGNHPNSNAIGFDANKKENRLKEISKADVVISMLPPTLHINIAKDCIALKKHMVTASYVSDEMKALDLLAKKEGVVIMNEVGVDPGIDHMSAMRVIDEVHDSGGKMVQFESFCGGLVAPESDNNPWNYKFTWNPRNVVLAGQGTAVKFIQENQYKYIPYHKLFRRTEIIEIEQYGKFEGYANRDSLKYRELYGLQGIPTIYRGTLRRPGFSRAWDIFVQLGMTDDSYIMEGSENMTYRQFLNSFLSYHPTDSVEIKLMMYLHLDQDDTILMDKVKWLGLFDNTKKVGIKDASPAQILQHILEQKWKLEEHDKDMIVMWHKFIYELKGKKYDRESSLIVMGDDRTFTSMAKTVGLPVGIATKLILNGTICKPGVHIPVKKEFYLPVLKELEENGIVFKEKFN